MKFVLVLTALFLSVSAHAYTAQCLLQIDGTTYINGDCNFSPHDDGTGSFSIGTDDPNSLYFAYVNIFDGVAYGYWNGSSTSKHAHDSLGELKHNGACRFNDKAIICAWAK